MTKLTLKPDMTAIEVVLYYFAEYDEEDVDYLLWNYTGYPFGSLEWVAEEVYEYYLRNKHYEK